jgi:NAD(P)-dependent dehydrogenase (short-subunit alcohol dehydrogenase family)
LAGDNRQRAAIVTGAGSGIGRAVAERLARSGDRVIGTVREPSRAAALSAAARGEGLSLQFRPLELASLDEIEAFADTVVPEGLDLLVNNAGFGIFGPVEEVDAAAVARQFQVNLLGPLALTRRLLPALRPRLGRIVWVGSLAGRVALPFQAHYSATKAAVAAISDALRLELRGSGVKVTCVEPGDFATNFTGARVTAPVAGSPYADRLAACLAAVERQEREGPGPERVAAAVERLSRRRHPPARYAVGPGAGTLCLLLRLFPDRLREWVVARRYRV